jgi:GGDEF domain-containing protein
MDSTSREYGRVTGLQWLREVAAIVEAAFTDLDVSWPDDDTVGLSRGLRTVVAHVGGEQVFVAPSFASGGTLASRLQDRVQHLHIQQFRLSDPTIEVAADAISAHLRG